MAVIMIACAYHIAIAVRICPAGIEVHRRVARVAGIIAWCADGRRKIGIGKRVRQFDSLRFGGESLRANQFSKSNPTTENRLRTGLFFFHFSLR